MGDSLRRFEYRGRGVADLLTHLPEQRVLKLAEPVLRVQDERLVLLHLRRDISLGVHERLSPDVLLRNLRDVGLADLDVVAEYLVVAHLERPYAGVIALLLL